VFDTVKPSQIAMAIYSIEQSILQTIVFREPVLTNFCLNRERFWNSQR
jgi:hypothetical protein